MFNPIEMRRRMVQERIEKSFDNEIEKAHKDGDIHPNGKWVWVSSAAGGKGDWRTINGRAHQKHNAAQGSASGGNTPEDNGYAEKFKKNFKDASDDVLNKVISGKIQGTDADKRLAKEILDERKSSAEGEKYAAKIIDLLKVSSSKYSDIKKVTAFKTDKGNWAIDYDGANTGIILNGSKLSEKGLKAAGVKIEGATNDTNSKADSKQDKIAQDAGFNNYDEMRGYQEYVTAKNLLKKPSTKGDARKEMETQVADYEKNHADVIKRIEAKNGKKKADKKSDDWNDNLSGYKTPPFEGAVKVADLKVGDKLVGHKGRTITVIGVNKTKDGTDVGVKFDNPRIGDGTHWSVFNNNSYYGAKKADDKLSGREVYYQTLAEKFDKTGKCESTDALIGVYKNNNPSKNIKAAQAFRKYIMNDLNYIDNDDWQKTLNEYKKLRLNANKEGDKDAYKAYDCAYQAVKDRIAKDTKNEVSLNTSEDVAKSFAKKYGAKVKKRADIYTFGNHGDYGAYVSVKDVYEVPISDKSKIQIGIVSGVTKDWMKGQTKKGEIIIRTAKKTTNAAGKVVFKWNNDAIYSIPVGSDFDKYSYWENKIK